MSKSDAQIEVGAILERMAQAQLPAIQATNEAKTLSEMLVKLVSGSHGAPSSEDAINCARAVRSGFDEFYRLIGAGSAGRQ